jgi:hypothetical protein
LPVEPARFQPAENLQGNLAAETQGLGSEALFVINLTRPGETPEYPTGKMPVPHNMIERPAHRITINRGGTHG